MKPANRKSTAPWVVRILCSAFGHQWVEWGPGIDLLRCRRCHEWEPWEEDEVELAPSIDQADVVSCVETLLDVELEPWQADELRKRFPHPDVTHG